MVTNMKVVNKILDSIENNEKIRRYKELELIINNNTKIKKILDDSKSIQKEIVHAENLSKPKQLKILNIKYNEEIEKLKEQPLLMEYLDLQKEINRFLQDSVNNINNALMFNLSDNKEK